MKKTSQQNQASPPWPPLQQQTIIRPPVLHHSTISSQNVENNWQSESQKIEEVEDDDDVSLNYLSTISFSDILSSTSPTNLNKTCEPNEQSSKSQQSLSKERIEKIKTRSLTTIRYKKTFFIKIYYLYFINYLI